MTMTRGFVLICDRGDGRLQTLFFYNLITKDFFFSVICAFEIDVWRRQRQILARRKKERLRRDRIGRSLPIYSGDKSNRLR